MKAKKSGLSTASLVLGIIAMGLSIVPIVNNISFILGLISIVFSIICFIKKEKSLKVLISLILSILAIVITICLQITWSKSLNNLSNELDTMFGNNTEEVLKNIDVKIGTFETEVDKYGYRSNKLTVTVTNKLSESKSYDIEIEAVSKDGKRIDSEYVYVSSLAGGQSQDFTIFEYVSEDKVELMKTAKFNIIEASMY